MKGQQFTESASLPFGERTISLVSEYQTNTRATDRGEWPIGRLRPSSLHLFSIMDLFDTVHDDTFAHRDSLLDDEQIVHLGPDGDLAAVRDAILGYDVDIPLARDFEVARRGTTIASSSTRP